MPKVSRDKLYAEIGQRIKQARSKQSPKLSQDALAERLGVERTSITNIESGLQRATVHFLYRVARELKLPLSDLLPKIDDENILEDGITHLEQLRLGKTKTVTVPASVKAMFDSM